MKKMLKMKFYALAAAVCMAVQLMPAGAVFAAEPVAKIGTDTYETLAAAFDAAQELAEWNGEPVSRSNPVEIDLTADTAVNEAILVTDRYSRPLTYHIRLNGGGKTVSRADGFTDSIIHVAQSSTLYLENITFDGALTDDTADDSIIRIAATGRSGMPANNDSHDNYVVIGKDAVLQNNHSSQTGGAVCLEAGTLILDGGTIKDNIADKSGGGVYVSSGDEGTNDNADVFYPAQFIMNNGTISGNKAVSDNNYGGGVDVETISKDEYENGTNPSGFIMNGGVIENNAAYDGGGISMGTYANVQILGGTIRNNRCENSSGVNRALGVTGILCNFGASPRIGGQVTITDLIGLSYYSTSSGGKQGTVIVDKELDTESAIPLRINVNTTNCPDGMPLVVRGESYDGTVSASDFAWKYTTDSSENTTRTLVASADGSQLLSETLNNVSQSGSTELTYEYGVKLGELDFSGCVVSAGDTGEPIEGSWSIVYGENENADTVPEINENSEPYEVTAVFTPNDAIYKKLEVTFSLTVTRLIGFEWGTDGITYDNFAKLDAFNQAMIDAEGTVYARLTGDVQLDDRISVPSNKNAVLDLAGYTLTIAHAGDDGVVMNGVYVNGGGTFTLEDSSEEKTGKITGSSGGSAIHVQQNGALIMNGGTITGNYGANQPGAVQLLANSSFTMNGGAITGNSSDNIQAGVSAHRSSSVVLSGNAVISDNTGMDGDCDLWFDTLNGALLTIGENGLTEDANIGVYINSSNFEFGQAFSNAYTEGKALASNFVSNRDDFEVREIDAGEGQKQLIMSRIQTIALTALPENEADYGNNVTLTATLSGANSSTGKTISFYNNAGETPVLLGTAETAASADNAAIGVAALTLELPDAGDYVLSAVFAGTENYEVVESDELTYKINQITPTVKTIPTAERVHRDHMLSESGLSGGVVVGLDGTTALEGTWTWKNDREMTENGTFEETAIFTPTDTNYAPIEVGGISVRVYWTSTGGGVPVFYRVTFDSCGGSSVSSKTVSRNATVSKPTDPERDGYIFDGWYTDRNCTDEYSFGTRITENITLYAKWIEDEEASATPTPSPTATPEPSTGWRNPFTDVSTGDWFYDAVRYANENGLFSGVTSTLFEPNTPITRGMLVTVLWRSEGEPVVNYLMTFTDVNQSAYYAEAVRWAASEGIVTGYSDTEFAPDRLISREEFAAVLERFADYIGMSTTEVGNLEVFDDADQVAEWARGNVSWAVGAGLLNGKGGGSLDPKGNTTRAEAATILQRLFEN